MRQSEGRTPTGGDGTATAEPSTARPHARARVSKTFVGVLVAVVAAAGLLLLPGAALTANPSANLDQCANGPAPSPSSDGCNVNASDWVNGNLGASKANYFEGDSIPYRLRLDNLSLNPGHTVTIEWDTTKSSKHAIDYIDSYNASVLNANPCLGVSGCSSFSTFNIPVDPQVSGAGVTQNPGVFTMYGGTITSVSAYTGGSTFPNGDNSRRITITFTPTVGNPVLAWGGHIATRKDWGQNNSAVSIPGSPYHTRLIDLDGSGGNQDRSLSADAVIFPGSITIVKDTVPNDSTLFSFTDTGGLVPTSFMLKDDGSNVGNSQAFNTITNFATYTFTEASVSHYTLSFQTPVCTVTSPNGGSQSGDTGTRTVTVNLKEGENVTCTFVNTHNVANPTIATTLSGTSVSIGTAVHDSATLSGATSDAGGTVAYTVYSDSGCSQNPQSAGTKNVTNGVVPDSDPITFNSAGTFYWQAVYSGDANNNGATSTCTSEILTVNKNSPTIATSLSSSSITVGGTVHDSATLSGATSDAGGTVTYTVYSDNTCQTFVADGGTKTVTNGSVPNSDPVTFNSAGTFYWQAVYSGDANNNGASSACQSETLVVGKASPTIATQLSSSSITVGGTVHDSATLSGATSDAGGSVTYTVYSDSSCTTFAANGGTKTVTNGSVPNSDPVTFNSAGTFYWQAVYSGDGNNNAASSACQSETLVVGKASPTIATSLSATTGNIGDSIHDSATLTGATSDAGGTVTYTVYTDNACSQGARDAGTVNVTNGSVPDSNSLQFNSAGTFYWQAVYSGDGNNNGATSACQSEVLTIAKNSPTIATSLSASTINVGDSAHDSSTLTGATSNAGGTVTYTVYSDSACTQNARDAGTKTVTNGVVPDSNSLQFNSAGTFYWQAVYSGDANNNGATSACTSEQLVVNAPTNVSQITPTGTTCQQFRDTQATTLSELDYIVRNGKVSSVTPGVFFYWVKVTAVAGSNTFTIGQTITTGNFDSHFFDQASGSFVYDSSCNKVSIQTITTSGGVTTVKFTASSAGTYFIGIKYNSKSVEGFTAPSPTTVHYDFETTGVAGSKSGLDLIKK
jgi:hypothetical protein